jgi:serine/threonine protein kinase
VAIKLLHDWMNADPKARSRLAREVAAARQVAAFCTARVLDSDLDDPRPYVVSEFIEGPSLHEVVTRDGPYTGTALERLAVGVATALAAIHRHGVIHRDLKPANVLIGADGPRVVDFGIARPIRQETGTGSEPLTATGAVIGTPGFLAPEQLGGASPSPAVDIFAWGATMTFAATGRLPFEGDTLPLALERLLRGAPDLHGMTGMTRELVAECLAKDPDERPTADELLLRLLGHATPQDHDKSSDRGKAPQTASGDLLNQGSRMAAMMPAPPAPSPPGESQAPPDRSQAPPDTPEESPAASSGPVPLPAESGSTRSSGSAVAVTVGALIVLLLAVPGGYLAVRSFPPDPGPSVPPTPAPVSSPRPTPTPATSPTNVIPADYAGTWSGTGYQRGNTWQVTITLSAGAKSGKVKYSNPCSGRLELAEVRKKEIEFTERITKNKKKCIVQGIVVLSRKGNGMDFVYRTHPGQKPAEATARLLKKE